MIYPELPHSITSDDFDSTPAMIELISRNRLRRFNAVMIAEDMDLHCHCVEELALVESLSNKNTSDRNYSSSGDECKQIPRINITRLSHKEIQSRSPSPSRNRTYLTIIQTSGNNHDNHDDDDNDDDISPIQAAMAQIPVYLCKRQEKEKRDLENITTAAAPTTAATADAESVYAIATDSIHWCFFCLTQSGKGNERKLLLLRSPILRCRPQKSQVLRWIDFVLERSVLGMDDTVGDIAGEMPSTTSSSSRSGGVKRKENHVDEKDEHDKEETRSTTTMPSPGCKTGILIDLDTDDNDADDRVCDIAAAYAGWYSMYVQMYTAASAAARNMYSTCTVHDTSISMRE